MDENSRKCVKGCLGTDQLLKLMMGVWIISLERIVTIYLSSSGGNVKWLETKEETAVE